MTWTAYNNQNQPTLQVLPAGNSVAYVYENGSVPGFSGTYNRRVGLLLSRTVYPGNAVGITPVRPGSSGQSQLTESFFYDPVFNRLCARVERRGNPINNTGGYFSPQNGGSASAARYATLTYYDYQKDAQGTVSGDPTLQALLGLSAAQIDSLYTYVNGQLSAAGLTGFPNGLGDVNGDGTGDGASSGLPAALHRGNVVKIQHPTVNLINPDPNTGLTTQPRVEVFTSNSLGQATTHTDPNGNLTVYVRYPYNDPEGNGGITEPGSSIPANLGGKQYGRLKEVHVDADPDDVLSLVGGDGDLVDFVPGHTGIMRYNAPGVYQDLVTRYEGGSGAAGSGCALCAYDAMGNPLAVTDPRGFTTRYDRNELGEVYRAISPQPYNFRVETSFDANRNVTRVDTEDLQPAFDSSDPSSALFAQFTPSGSSSTAHVPMQPGPGGTVRPGWFTNLFSFDLLDDKIEEDIDTTGSTPANLVTTFLYDSNQNLIQTTKPQGNLVEYDYDERNLRIALRVGRDMGLSPPEPGAVTVTAYDANGNVLQVIGPAARGGATATATMEDAFRSGLTLTHTGDLALNNTYDGFDRVIQAADALGNYVDTGVGYTSDPFLDPDGRVIRSDRYGPVGGGSGTIVMLAGSKMRFDEGGRQYEAEEEVFLAGGTTLPSGRAVTHSGGGLAANSAANNHTGTVTLTSGGSSYVLTRMIFDAGGRTVATLADNAAQTTFGYDGADRQTQATDALGNVVANQFDAAGNLVGSTRTEKCTIPGVATTETFSSAMFYDSLNRLVLQAEQGADGVLNANLVLYFNGPFWQLSGSTLVTVTGYDSRGNRVLSVDPKGNSSVTVFDGASRTIQTQQHLRQAGQGQNPPAANGTFLPGGGASITTTMLLDGNGRQTQLIDDRGDVTLFAYDTMDREVQMTFHDGSTRESVYDEAGDVVTFTDENGSVFQNTFDALGRKTAVAVTPAAGVGGTTGQAMQYDGLSRMTFARDAVGASNADVTLVHDSLGRVLEDSQAYAGHVRNVTNTAFTSHPATQFTFPSGRAIDNAYDLLYRRASVAEDSPAAAIAGWSFFGPSRVAEVQLGNGLISTWMNNARTNSAVQSGVPNPAWGNQSSDRLGYDGSGRMITKRCLAHGIGGDGRYNDTSAVVGFTTEYDRSSNKFFERALHAEQRSHLYEPFVNQVPQGGYDSLDRLLQYQRGTLSSSGGFHNAGGGSIASAITLPNTDTQRSYLLDGLGNWRNTAFTPVGSAAETEVRQHNGLNQTTRRQNPAASDPLINPTYDSSGNLTNDGTLSYTWDALNRLVSAGLSANYVYDALDRRIRKTVSGQVTDCLYSGWRCVEDRDVSNNPSVQYVWGIYLDEIIQQKNVAALNGFSAGAVLYPLQDLLYRTTALADTSATPVVREAYDFDTYGATLIFRNGSPPGTINFDNSDTQVAAPTCPFLFTGQRFDPESGLYYYKRRFYSPALGRFLSRDPIRYLGGDPNLFRYVENRPVCLIDPTGMLSWACWAALGTAELALWIAIPVCEAALIPEPGEPPCAGACLFDLAVLATAMFAAVAKCKQDQDGQRKLQEMQAKIDELEAKVDKLLGRAKCRGKGKKTR